ncbi:MAG: hypothetical protein OEL78_01675 [Hyphomicrobiales bacterium]|nr:hypothetical protein [Hyphomicrobiales bacterium]
MAGENVSISEMREWVAAIFDAIEVSGIKELSFEGRLYWRVHTGEVWGPEPPKAIADDLADDLKDIRSDVTEDLVFRSTFAWHTFDHFIGALTRLSAELKGFDFSSQRAWAD